MNDLTCVTLVTGVKIPTQMVARAIVGKRYPFGRPPQRAHRRIIGRALAFFLIRKITAVVQAFPHRPLLAYARQAQPLLPRKQKRTVFALAIAHAVDFFDVVRQLQPHRRF